MSRQLDFSFLTLQSLVVFIINNILCSKLSNWDGTTSMCWFSAFVLVFVWNISLQKKKLSSKKGNRAGECSLKRFLFFFFSINGSNISPNQRQTQLGNKLLVDVISFLNSELLKFLFYWPLPHCLHHTGLSCSVKRGIPTSGTCTMKHASTCYARVRRYCCCQRERCRHDWPDHRETSSVVRNVCRYGCTGKETPSKVKPALFIMLTAVGYFYGSCATRWYWAGLVPDWREASTRRPMSMPPTITTAPACTTPLLQAWRSAWRWEKAWGAAPSRWDELFLEAYQWDQPTTFLPVKPVCLYQTSACIKTVCFVFAYCQIQAEFPPLLADLWLQRYFLNYREVKQNLAPLFFFL